MGSGLYHLPAVVRPASILGNVSNFHDYSNNNSKGIVYKLKALAERKVLFFQEIQCISAECKLFVDQNLYVTVTRKTPRVNFSYLEE